MIIFREARVPNRHIPFAGEALRWEIIRKIGAGVVELTFENKKSKVRQEAAYA